MTRTKQEALTALIVEALEHVDNGTVPDEGLRLSSLGRDGLVRKLRTALELLGVPDELIRQRPLFRLVK